MCFFCSLVLRLQTGIPKKRTPKWDDFLRKHIIIYIILLPCLITFQKYWYITNVSKHVLCMFYVFFNFFSYVHHVSHLLWKTLHFQTPSTWKHSGTKVDDASGTGNKRPASCLGHTQPPKDSITSQPSTSAIQDSSRMSKKKQVNLWVEILRSIKSHF